MIKDETTFQERKGRFEKILSEYGLTDKDDVKYKDVFHLENRQHEIYETSDFKELTAYLSSGEWGFVNAETAPPKTILGFCYSDCSSPITMYRSSVMDKQDYYVQIPNGVVRSPRASWLDSGL